MNHDYSCSLTHKEKSITCAYPMVNYFTYDHFSKLHQAFLAMSLVKEPQYYHEAVTDARWRNVMDKELTAL